MDVGASDREKSQVSGADVLVDHIVQCTDAGAVVVVDGSADDIIGRMLAAGWTVEQRVDRVAGKRIRFLHPPADSSPAGQA